MRQVRIFVSSPSDASHERMRVERVVQRVNAEFGEFARLDAFRWETGFYQAHTTFQAQIPQAAECDVVIAIFRGRLGTELPPNFPRMPDGAPYPSGTAYELLTAMDARRKMGTPDVYVFRCDQPPTIRLDDPNAARIEDDWRRLKQFFDTWFLTREGHFTGAFHSFSSTDDFDEQISGLLRSWLEEKVLRGRAISWPTEVLGSPFRGLAAFGAKHAPVFFGRSRDIARSLELWKRAADAGSPFLLVVGGSGAGKSSLAHAGIIPRLTAPGVVPEVDVWRVATLRPSEIAGGPILTLATRLLDTDDDIPEEESGRPRALPELAEGDHQDSAHLAALFRQAPEISATPVVRALDRVGEIERARHSYDRPVRTDLVILVDQLDELFGAYVDPEERVAFCRLLEKLVDTGRVWLIATLRADLYELFLREPALLALKAKGSTYDLVPPGPAELAEIVRKPAEAAGLLFETDPESGESLDAKLLREADRPDMLPLLQLMLNRLFENRAVHGDNIWLTISAERELGGLAGVIDHEGEEAVSRLSEAELAALPRLLRRLAAIGRYPGAEVTSGPQTVTIRTVPLSRAADKEAAAGLIQALLDARLLLTSGEGAASGIRLAHERILTDWARARELVGANAEYYRVRDEIEEAQRRWEAAKQSRDLLIPRGLPLAEAESVLARFGDELAPGCRAFVQTSGRRARRRHRFAQAAAVLFAVLALAATAGGIFAERAQQRAERSLDAAKQAVKVIVGDVANGLRNVQGIGTDRIRTVLEDIRQTVQGLVQEAPNDTAIARLDLEMLDEFATTYFTVDDLDRAQASASDALALARTLSARDASPEWQRAIAVSLAKLGAVKLRRGDTPAAMQANEQAVEGLRRLLQQAPDRALWQQDLAAALGGIGDAKVRMGDAVGALDAYREALGLTRRLGEQRLDDLSLKQRVAETLNKIGDIELNRGAHSAATAEYDEALAITRDLINREPGNTQWQRGLFVGLTRMGDLKRQDGNATGALIDYDQAATLMRHLTKVDSGNPQMRWDLAATLVKIGDAKFAAGDREACTAAYDEALDLMRRLAKNDSANRLWQRDLAVSLNKVGDMNLLAGDTAAAQADYDEALTILQRVAARDPADATWVRDIAISFDKIGTLKLRAGDPRAAIASFEQALVNVRLLAQRDPANTAWQRDVAVTQNKLADAKLATGQRSEALAAYEQALSIARHLAERDSGNAVFQADLAFTLNRIGDARAREKDTSGARASYRDAVQINRGLAERDPSNTSLQTGLIASLYRLASVEQGNKREQAAREALAILERLQGQTKLNADQAGWPAMIRAMLSAEPIEP